MKTIKHLAVAAMMGLSLYAGATPDEVDAPITAPEPVEAPCTAPALPDFKVVSVVPENHRCNGYADIVVTVENIGKKGNSGTLKLTTKAAEVTRFVGTLGHNARKVIRFNHIQTGSGQAYFLAHIDAYDVTREDRESNNKKKAYNTCRQ